MPSFITTEGFGSSGPVNLSILSIAASPLSITIIFSSPVIVAGNASLFTNWSITPTDNTINIAINAVSGSGSDTVVLTTTEGKIGGSYNLSIPQGIIKQADSSPLIPPYIVPFTGNGIAPTVIEVVRNDDARNFEVSFSEPVAEVLALDPANYLISPSLAISKVTKVSNNRYTVTTLDAQTPNQVYTVTVSNIKDLFDNLI